MRDAEAEQHEETSNVARHAFAARLQPLELDREADPEQEREERVELSDDQPFQPELDRSRQTSPEVDKPHRLGRRADDEAHQVGEQDPEQRESAQCVDHRHPLAGGDGHAYGRSLNAPPPVA